MAITCQLVMADLQISKLANKTRKSHSKPENFSSRYKLFETKKDKNGVPNNIDNVTLTSLKQVRHRLAQVKRRLIYFM